MRHGLLAGALLGALAATTMAAAQSAPATGRRAGAPAPAPAAKRAEAPRKGGFVLPAGAVQHSVARLWNETLLEAIRLDYARPTVHARNLYHMSVATWDAWAAYDAHADTVITHERHTAADVEAARNEAISYACYRLMGFRFALSPNAAQTLALCDALMIDLGYDTSYTGVIGDDPASFGNRIAQNMIVYGLGDGSNEAGGFANLFYEPVNPPLIVALPGNPTILDLNRWQPLAIDFYVDQSGNPIPGGYPPFLSPEWGTVKTFAMTQADLTIHQRDGHDWWTYHDPGAPPEIGGPGDDVYKWGFTQVAIWSSHLDPSDGVMIDASPASIGNAPIAQPSEYEAFYDLFNGGDWGEGYDLNPVTGQPYQTQMVPRGDYARILAEFWADGPASETPPGHWFTIANYVSDHPDTEKRIGGEGPIVDALEWDVKTYLSLGGAVHDAAVAVWGVKGFYDYIRPVSAIRAMADRGQSSDPQGPSYDPMGIPLHPGLVEVVTNETIQPGERHEHLAGADNENVGKIAIYGWRGPDYISDPAVDEAGVGWILAENWWPYQRPSFVSPPFAGYVSGHSCFSRSAAELMSRLTGSEYFPGGMGEFYCPANEFLVFEEGPSVDITLQWAKYADASDQCSLSRIWGGIHPGIDDLPGRIMGLEIGPEAWDHARAIFAGVAHCPGDLDDDGGIGFADLLVVLSQWGPCPDACSGDLDLDGVVDFGDVLTVLSNWGNCPPPG